MRELDSVTQQNTAMAEEAAASSQMLLAEAQSLSGIVARFDMDEAEPKEEALEDFEEDRLSA